jgi:ribose transport system substrate-binding protein
LLLAVAGCGGGPPTASQAPVGAGPKHASHRIGAVLPMFAHPFFLAQKRGLEEKAKELNLTIDVRDGQDDDQKQIGQVEALLNRGIDLLILCPRDEDALVPAVESANRAGVPVVTMNRRVNGGKVVTYVGADDAEGGRSQGKALAGALGPQGGKIIYLQGTQGSSPQRQRNKGFKEVLLDHSVITIADDRFAAFQEDKAKAVMTDLVRRHDAGTIRAIVAQADEMALPAAEVARAEGWKDALVIGFNGTQSAFDAIRAGHMYATVLQDPVEQGARAVEAAANYLDGKVVKPEVLTPLPVVTKENVDKYSAAY